MIYSSMKAHGLLILFCLIFAGCTSLKFDAAKSAAITSRGLASIQGSQEPTVSKVVGPRIVRYLVAEVDDPKVVVKRPEEILELTPGLRKVKATAYFQVPRFGGFDVYTFSADFSFSALAGRSYEVRGRGSENYCSLGIYEVGSDSPAAEEAVGAPSLSTVQRAPMIIYY